MQMLELANGSMMWLFSGLIIAAAVMQSLVLYRLPCSAFCTVIAYVLILGLLLPPPLGTEGTTGVTGGSTGIPPPLLQAIA